MKYDSFELKQSTPEKLKKALLSLLKDPNLIQQFFDNSKELHEHLTKKHSTADSPYDDAFFIAKTGTHFDSHSLIANLLIDHPNIYIVSNHSWKKRLPKNEKLLFVEDTTKLLNAIYSKLFEILLADSHVYSVTGTNGKSSIVSLIHQFYTSKKIANLAIGTLGYQYYSSTTGKKLIPSDLTTPGSLGLLKTLSQLKEPEKKVRP